MFFFTFSTFACSAANLKLGDVRTKFSKGDVDNRDEKDPCINISYFCRLCCGGEAAFCG